MFRIGCFALVCTAIAIGFSSHSSLAVDLKGTIVDADGKPIDGATAYIYTAGARRGTSTYCPSCYLDCGKTGKSDTAGEFAINELDPSLVFQVLFVADGYKPLALKKVDPVGSDVTATLALRPKLPDDPKRVIQGRVANEQDEPIAGATIEVSDRRLPGGVTTGYPQGIDLVVFSDEQGEFSIVADEPILAVSLQIQAKDAARKKFSGVAPGRVRRLQLTRGHNFNGRVVHDGKPVAGAVVGLAQLGRSMDDGFVGDFTAETDKNGVYHFYNAPPNDSFCIYGKIASLASRGGIEAVDVKSGKDGGATNLEDLELKPAHTIAGRITLSDGGAVPPGTQVLASREKAWDSQSVEADEEGNFRFEGLPNEAYTISTRIPGYRLSAKNKSLDVLNRYLIRGLVDRNNEKLVMLFEPGEPEAPNYSAPQEELQAMYDAFNALSSSPLRGAE